MSSRAQGSEHPQRESAVRMGRALPRLARGASRAALLVCFAFMLSAILGACREPYAYAALGESLEEGQECRANVAFQLNRRPVKLELYLRLEGKSALVELYHPDGRRTEIIEVAGPGFREIRKEYVKEPGSWGLRVTARGGSLRCWAALHDRNKFQGPDEGARLLVEGGR
jgi:hypothetical protein